jgi:hypothetical protein
MSGEQPQESERDPECYCASRGLGFSCAASAGELCNQVDGRSGPTVDPLIYRLMAEMQRQDEKHGPFEGTLLGRSRLAIACLEDEVAEAREAWRSERKASTWDHTREELLQVAAVAMRALRDTL